jgi:hypothetical protein
VKSKPLTLAEVSFMIDALFILSARVTIHLLRRERDTLDIIRDLVRKRSGR